MRVNRDFEQIYKSEEDPWRIGKADSDRYNRYFEIIQRKAGRRGHLLDIGCGYGAFTSRFKDFFDSLTGIEISLTAVEKGRSKNPFIQFLQGSADRLPEMFLPRETYDFIIYSDVVYYLDEKGKNSSLEWIASHLEEEGLAFIAGWSPGKRYLNRDEFLRLVRKYFAVEEEYFLETGHSGFLCRKKKNLIAATVDYETWHPIPEGKTIDWEKDVFEPADKMLAMAQSLGIPMTFFAEMGEYFWLMENEPGTARKMEAQWRRAVQEGHDIQLHLHPNWLPELGAKFEGGQWDWDWTKAKAADYPGDLAQVIGKCKQALENLLRPVKPDYRVTAFRAGAYQAQPFAKLFQALEANGISCDSSVYQGGVSGERGYDYLLASSDHQPYWTRSLDPQFQSSLGEEKFLEIPIFTYAAGERWFLDGEEGVRLSRRLLEYFKTKGRYFRSSESYRILLKLIGLFLKTGFLNQIFPRLESSFRRENEFTEAAGNEYFVMIGHTKGDHDYGQISRNFENLKGEGKFQFVALSEMVWTAKKDLENSFEKKKESVDLQKILVLMNGVYAKLDPEKPSTSQDPEEILRGGYAWCWGYVVVLGHLLKKEGFDVRWLTMLAQDHPKGRGDKKVDSHEVVLTKVGNRNIILDPMANSLIPYSIEEVLVHPPLAGPKSSPDERYRRREYYLYDTDFWYGRVFKYVIRKDPGERIWFWQKARRR